MTVQPITYRVVAGTLIPKQRWLFDRTFADGQEYELAVHEPRSSKSQDHYHAAVREGWKNLPEKMAKKYPDPDALRKFALIRCDFYKERTIVCETEEAAAQIAAFAGSVDESAVVTIQGTIVTIAVARSQKTTGPGAMNKQEFQDSKQKVLEYIASLIGVDVATLSSQVPDSSGAQQQASSDRTDTPAANGPPSYEAAGVTNSEVSLLSDDWLDTYIVALSGVRDKAASLPTRHAEAEQMIGGKPNILELALMRHVYRLVQRRNQAIIKPGEYEAEIAKLKASLLSEKDAA